MQTSLHLRRWLLSAAALPMVLVLAACGTSTPRSYVVLLPDADGNVGQVIVSGGKGRQVLTQSGQMAALDGGAVHIALSQAQIAAEFGEARAAQPVAPEHFMLYFLTGGTRLTMESEMKFADILARWKARPQNTVSELVVIGHTDTVGSDESNTALAMQRARSIAERLRDAGIRVGALTLESHGEKNPLVPTRDGVAEPRNRRVQVTIR
ncbi:OmpA family protein [Hydrogenophaga laconesensis]|uniref:Adhesin transport system outer membrane protein n=1 Tax=Hydrogenophaga laconesensis TaxID=1805971 RepID=A0ABU1VFL6_9BURK|nr:OmpA family protein [Hydrogenophaga laconesensis]MDR7095983.1 adhesin transport system outer membrane protein [Hydrogenophaga laconesensis]